VRSQVSESRPGAPTDCGWMRLLGRGPPARGLKTAQSVLNDLGEPEGSRIQI
jgi:hypothetical protein